jgi:ISXO2-like transposase domain
VIRERGGNSVPAVFGSESQAASFIRARIAKGTTVHADESSAWDGLNERFEMKRIDHSQAYSFDGACTNQPKNISAACAVRKLGFTITLQARICSATRRKVHGVRIQDMS